MNENEALNFALNQVEKHSETESMIALRSLLIRNFQSFSAHDRVFVSQKIAEIEAELDALML